MMGIIHPCGHYAADVGEGGRTRTGKQTRQSALRRTRIGMV